MFLCTQLCIYQSTHPFIASPEVVESCKTLLLPGDRKLTKHYRHFCSLLQSEIEYNAKLWPTWWPLRSALSAPAPRASQTDRAMVPLQPERTRGSGPGKWVGLGSPTHTAGLEGRSRGGLESWSCPLSRSKPLHTLREGKNREDDSTGWGWT